MLGRKNTIKLQDTVPDIGSGSRLENYWKSQMFEQFYKKFRSGMRLPSQFHTVQSVQSIVKLFKLHGIGFGNWVTQEDRFNYVSALIISLYDIDKVIKFKGNMGLSSLVSFSFGARGNGSALAHFEPSNFVINITRYSNGQEAKDVRFVNTGGAGSVAHEYGHALDYYFGYFHGNNALSGGDSVSKQPMKGSSPLVGLMNEVLKAAIWNAPEKLSDYYSRLTKNYGGDYMFRRCEIFARLFERYVQLKLRDIGILNKFLTETKYSENAYPTEREMKFIIPKMDALISAMSKKL